MFKVGDCVLHQKTGHSGKVVGYGHQILDSVYPNNQSTSR